MKELEYRWVYKYSNRAVALDYYLSLQISIMRPPNYTVLMIWAAVVIAVLVFAYWKRENLTILYNSQNWAFLAIVCNYKNVWFLKVFLLFYTGCNPLYGVWTDVESYSRTTHST